MSEDKNKQIELFNYPISGDREVNINNDVWKPNSSLKILPARGFRTHNPNHYMYTDSSTSNPVGYEWAEKKHKNDIVEQTGLESETGECILYTLSWDNFGKDKVSEKAQGFANLRQKVFFIDSGNTYFRKSANAQGDSWTQWKPLGGGGSVDITQALVDLFNKWKEHHKQNVP